MGGGTQRSKQKSPGTSNSLKPEQENRDIKHCVSGARRKIGKQNAGHYKIDIFAIFDSFDHSNWGGDHLKMYGMGFGYLYAIDEALLMPRLSEAVIRERLRAGYYKAVVYGSQRRGLPFLADVIASLPRHRVWGINGEDGAFTLPVELLNTFQAMTLFIRELTATVCPPWRCAATPAQRGASAPQCAQRPRDVLGNLTEALGRPLEGPILFVDEDMVRPRSMMMLHGLKELLGTDVHATQEPQCLYSDAAGRCEPLPGPALPPLSPALRGPELTKQKIVGRLQRGAYKAVVYGAIDDNRPYFSHARAHVRKEQIWAVVGPGSYGMPGTQLATMATWFQTNDRPAPPPGAPLGQEPVHCQCPTGTVVR